MATKVIMPQGGQDLTEGTILSWLKNEGDAVKEGEVICEVETEKATFEVSAPCDGVLLKIITPVGETAKVFSTIGIVGEPGESVVLDEIAEKKKGEGKAKRVDISAIREGPGKEQGTKPNRIKASGRAKKRAREKCVDLAQIQGTGPGGRIVEKDVLAYFKQTEAKPAEVPPVSAPPQPAAAGPVLAQEAQGRTEPMSKMRKVIARRMQQSKQTVPHFYVTVSVEMTEALKLREELNAQVEADSPAKISINDMIVKAVALALEEFYQMNCVIQDDNIVYLDKINIGIAVGLDEGLVVPVLPDADIISLRRIAKKTKELVTLAEEGKQAGLTQGSFTISNMGMLDVENFIPIINPPESAILGVSSIQKSVVVSENNALSIRDIMKMTISVDHRVIDGVVAAKFVNKIKYHLQNPRTLLS